MSYPVHITLRHMDSSPAVEELIHQEAAALNQYFDRITDCRVVVEAPHHHRQRGQAYHVHLDLGVPRKRIVARYEPSSIPEVGHDDNAKPRIAGQGEAPAQKDAYLAVRGAFNAARRQLIDYVDKLRGEVKEHSLAAQLVEE